MWNKIKWALLLCFLLILSSYAVSAVPTGASATPGPTSTRPADAATSHGAYGGNITELTINRDTQTQVWQGYYGQASGTIVLEDALSDRIYDWSTGVLQGEVYASQSNSVTWASIAAENDCTTDESLTGTGSDRVNNTFTPSSNSAFQVGSITISANTACALNTFVNSVAQSTYFEEVLLTDGSDSVYTAILEDNQAGYDNNPYDFQLLVPDDNDGTTTTYYFYIELG